MTRILTLAALSLIIFLTGCRKGEDDPFLSLSSRKARMAGNWSLVGGNLKVGAKYRDTVETLVYDLKPDAVTLTVTINGSSTIYGGQYNLALNMDKKGSFDFTEKVGTTELKASGRWSFNSGVSESKKKSDVIYIIEEVQKGATADVSLFNKLNTNFEYFIRELRNKKLVLETSSFVYINSNGDYQGIEGTLEFAQ